MHADNCAGGNRNRLVLFCHCFLKTTGITGVVGLNFMVVVHTKNIVDEAVEQDEKKIITKDARATRETVKSVDLRSTFKSCSSASLVNWRQ